MKLGQVGGGLLDAVSAKLRQHGAGDVYRAKLVLRRHQHVHQHQLAVEVAGKGTGIVRGPHRTFREIDRQKNAGKCLHERLLKTGLARRAARAGT